MPVFRMMLTDFANRKQNTDKPNHKFPRVNDERKVEAQGSTSWAQLFKKPINAIPGLKIN